MNQLMDEKQPGHLYKFITVLGTLLVTATSTTFALVINTHDVRVWEMVSRLEADKPIQIAPATAQFLTQKRDDVPVIGKILATIGGLGGVMVLGGIWFWFWKVQRLEDLKRQLEYEELSAKLDEAKSKKRILM
jgi:hypothetical protein